LLAAAALRVADAALGGALHERQVLAPALGAALLGCYGAGASSLRARARTLTFDQTFSIACACARARLRAPRRCLALR
jgi:hypothetical protein